ncbi:hypothetical protein LXA43DRAFT_1063287 [Ganoderma leucocontextum]|nr:hypothetical protein LXA43DRAFT_1063287 [Ganoderma leucocontextum]
MAPLTARTSSDDGAAGDMPPMGIADIVISVLLGAMALAAFLIFGRRSYRALVEWWKRSRTAAPPSSAPSSATLPAQPSRASGGATHPTGSLPRFACNLGAAMHLPLPKTSSGASRPMSSLRAYPIGMGPSHTRRGSDSSTNSTAGLLRVPAPRPAPTSPKPAFLGGRVATGQRSTL